MLGSPLHVCRRDCMLFFNGVGLMNMVVCSGGGVLMLNLFLQLVENKGNLNLVTQARGRNQPAELGVKL